MQQNPEQNINMGGKAPRRKLKIRTDKNIIVVNTTETSNSSSSPSTESSSSSSPSPTTPTDQRNTEHTISVGFVLDKFPRLKNYILNCKNIAERLVRLNLVIANVRSVIGWKNVSGEFKRYVIDMNTDEDLCELGRVKDFPVQYIVLKSMVEILWYTLQALVEPGTSDYEDTKTYVYSMACE